MVRDRGGVPVMAKQYRPLNSGLMVPEWMPDMRDRRRVESSRGFIFTPGNTSSFRPCRCPCTTFSDDFATDTVNDDPETDWGIKSGTWTVESGILSTTSSSAIVIANSSSLSFTGHKISCKLKALTGSFSRIIFSYDDEPVTPTYNYIEVEWNGVSSVVRIKDTTGATIEESAAQSYTNGSWYTFYVCVASGYVHVYTTSMIVEGTVTSTKAKCGVGTGTNSGTLSFDDFSYDDCLATCSCSGVPKTPDGTVSVFHHVVNDDGTITRVDSTFPCITYYVDSVSGGGAESGSGTEDDPWTNLNTVFSDNCIYSLCTTFCCPMVKVLIKGTIDYAIVGNAARNYLRRLVLEPWSIATVEVDRTGIGSVYAIINCFGCVFKYFDVTSVGTTNGIGFWDCYYNAFDHCDSTGLGVGFSYCGSSAFDNCNGTGTGPSGFPTSAGFSHNDDCTFKSCVGYAAQNNTSDGWDWSDDCVFDSCLGTGAGVNWGFGFVTCVNAAFKNCEGICLGAAVGCGFAGNTGAAFIDCSATDCGGMACDV